MRRMSVGRASTAVFMLLAGFGLLTAAACGGGSSSSKDATATHTVAPGATASGTDASFVNDLCKAGRTFADSITATLKEPNVLSDPTALVSKLRGTVRPICKVVRLGEGAAGPRPVAERYGEVAQRCGREGEGGPGFEQPPEPGRPTRAGLPRECSRTACAARGQELGLQSVRAFVRDVGGVSQTFGTGKREHR